jgi:hypothetical protein
LGFEESAFNEEQVVHVVVGDENDGFLSWHRSGKFKLVKDFGAVGVGTGRKGPGGDGMNEFADMIAACD